MDKSWMKEDRRSLKFQIGLEEFLKFALANARDTNSICCPCLKCCNNDFWSIGVIKDHIFFNGIDVSYRHWKWHGEPSTSALNVARGDSETVEMNPDFGIEEDEEGMKGSEDEGILEDSNEFMKFVEDGDKPLYPGCTKTTKLNGLIQTFNLKAKHGMTDACYSDMLIMIGLLLPEGNELPGSVYEAKRTLCALGMEYQKIHACPNDCILYRLQHADATSCPTCGESRWKLGRDKSEKEGVSGNVLWYFPPIPRFKRMFQSTVSAKELTWHVKDRKKDGMMRHPTDSPTWKMIDTKWPDFGVEPRNLRLALSSDGFNPHSSLSSKYSCWPVILITYNLPPWLCMKRKYMMLTLLISGPKQPGNDIDVYLQPLIDDLKVLWDGVERVYDAVRGEYFTLRAALFWTINDFPVYGNLSGSIVKGYNACPVCVEETKPYRLKKSKKMAFMRHRRFLPRYHPYRKQAAAFDNTVEEGEAPKPLSGEEVLSRVQGLDRPFGKKNPPPPYKGLQDQNRPCWKKKSVFFELAYWKHLPVRHNLDVMHIEKNCCDAILGTLLNIPGKTKDGAATHLDMVDMGIRTDLKATSTGKRERLPLASWNLFLDERKIVCSSFFNMTVPVRFSSNVRNLVSMEELRLAGLKSHDCHTIMQLLLPVALRSVLEKPVRYAIIRFCLFFKAICSKVIDVSKLEQMQADLVNTVCLLEKFFPPSFFDIMIHRTVHLVREVELCGPVFFRWMYPFERYMKVFKGWVRNRQFPEGCIAESYIVEEAIEFCSERILPEDATTIGTPLRTKYGLLNGCKPLSGATIISVNQKQLDLAHLCVLQNTEDAILYFTEHMELLKLSFPRFIKNKKWLKKKQNLTFAGWLKERVANEMRFADNAVSESIRWLAGGPKKEVPTFSGYHVNGVDFNTIARDKVRSVQNSGVFLVADDAFVIPKECQKMVITSAANKWREFKSKLTNLYIIPYMNEPDLLEFPPDDYRSITKDNWQTFVADRLSASFLEVREAQIMKRKENKYPHRMARKGYANLQEELSESMPLEQLDRATMWIKARQDKNGQFKQAEVEETTKKIENLKKREAEGEITTSGSEDVLTIALGNPEHHGRVRGVGGTVKPAAYFHLPKRQRKSVEETVRSSVKQILEEEKDCLIAKERAKWEEERDRQLAEERAYWSEKIARIEAKIDGKELAVDTPKSATLVNEVGSGQGSCSRPGENGVNCNGEIEIVTAAKKKLDLRDEGNNIVLEKELVHATDEKAKPTAVLEEKSRGVFAVPKARVNDAEVSLGQNECKLAIDSVENIVAIGTMINVDLETNQQTIHGASLGEENVRVSIIRTLVPEALLPFPIKDEIVTLKDAIGTCVAWPKNLVITLAADAKKKLKRKNQKKRTMDMFEDNEDLRNLPPNLPTAVSALCIWANHELQDGATIYTTFDVEIFGHRRKAVVFRSDIHAMANMLELSGGCIVFFMSYLHDVLKRSKMTEMVAFVDPDHMGALGCGNPTERARSLSNRFQNGKRGQIYLVPYNSGSHWMLSVVNPDEEIIYFMDPLKRRLITGEWKTILDNSIKIYNANKNRKGRKLIQWKNLAGIPEQNGGKSCGYWIMRYMKEIVEDTNLEFATKWDRRTNLVYTEKDIDEVRAEWAKHVMKFAQV